MATGDSEQTNISTTKDSEEIFELCCSTCAENDRTTEAKKYCKDCAEYFCNEFFRKFRKFHNTFSALRNHTVTGTSGHDLETRAYLPVVKEALPKCVVHHGQTVEKFCRGHHEVCCQTCIAAKHRYIFNK